MLLKIIVVVLLLMLFNCTTVNHQAKFYYHPVDKTQVHKTYKQPFYFIKGIDDTCDTSLYKCIDMNSRQYELRMK